MVVHGYDPTAIIQDQKFKVIVSMRAASAIRDLASRKPNWVNDQKNGHQPVFSCDNPADRQTDSGRRVNPHYSLLPHIQHKSLITHVLIS